MPSGLLLSLLFGVEAGPPPPPPSGPSVSGPERDPSAGAFDGRGGALPSRYTSDKFRWLQWNWKLGNIFGNKEYEAWRKTREKPSALELKLVDDARLRHKEDIALREQDRKVGREFRQKMLLAQEQAQVRKAQEAKDELLALAAAAGVKVKIAQVPVNPYEREEKRAQEARDKTKAEQMALLQKFEDEKALQMKIKMAKLRAMRGRKK